MTATVLEILRREKASSISSGIYSRLQVDFTDTSSRIEGNRLDAEQVQMLYSTGSVPVGERCLNVDDLVEVANHFQCIDMVIDQANYPVTSAMMKRHHAVLKNGTSDARRPWFVVGDYKKVPNQVGGQPTSSPENVKRDIDQLLNMYKSINRPSFDDIVDFHYRFEAIHPFQDGNGRIGRLLALKECLKWGYVPFIIDEALKPFYYRGLREYEDQPGFLRETCRAGQDKMAQILDYFRVAYSR